MKEKPPPELDAIADVVLNYKPYVGRHEGIHSEKRRTIHRKQRHNSMSDNPLAGISIPSIEEIVEAVMDAVPKLHVDLSNPIMRERLRSHLSTQLNLKLQFELERALKAVTEKAIVHVFRTMRDAEYQKRRKEARERQRANREKRRAVLDSIDKKLSQSRRMTETAERVVVVPKGPKVTLQ